MEEQSPGADGILDGLAVAALLVRDGAIVDANAALCALSGRTRGELEGTEADELFAEPPDAREVDGFVPALLRHADGTLRRVDVSRGARDTKAPVWVVRPTPAEPHTRGRELELLNDVAAASAQVGLDRLAPAVLQRTCRAIDAALATLVLVDPERRELFLAGAATAEEPVAVPPLRFPMERGPLSRVLATRRPHRYGPDELLDPRGRALVQKYGVRHIISGPLLVKDRVLGMLSVMRAEGRFSDDELRLLVSLCAPVSVAVEASRLFVETQRRADDLALVQAVGEAMARSLEPATMLREAGGRIARVLEADAVGVWVRQGRAFRNACLLGVPAAAAAEVARLPPSDPVVSLALEATAPFERDVATLGEPARSALGGLGLARIAVAPLASGTPGGAVARSGMLGLARRAPRRFDEPELRVLGAVASQLAVALQNAQLFDETRHRVEDLAVVLEAGRALIGAAPLDEALDVVADRLAKLVRMSCCEILLLEADTGVLRGAGASAPVRPYIHDVALRPGDPSLARLAVEERRPQWSADPMHDPRVSQGLRRLRRPRSLEALPLMAGDRVVGVVMLHDPDEARRLSDLDVDRAMAIGNQVAIAVERARLNEDLERSYRELARTQEQLVRREKLAAVGELAALVAHEVRNPLAVIFSSLRQLGRMLELEGDARLLFRMVREEATRLDRIVGDLLDFARPTQPALEPGALDRVVGDAVQGAAAFDRGRGTPPERLRALVKVDPGLPPVRLDERQMRQALMNLLANAFQALGRGGGHVEVEAGLVGKGDRTVARVTVRDNGPGIPPQVRARMFEPFVTTKATGSGLGLAVVRRIVESHRGEISFESTPEKGTAFFVDLPLSEG